MIQDLVIQKLDAAKHMLAEAKTVQQTKKVMDMARAAEIYAVRQGLGDDAIRYAHAIKYEALDQLGRLLEAATKNVGARGSVVPNKHRAQVKDPTPTLAELGLPATKDGKLSSAGKKVSASAQAFTALSVAMKTEVKEGKTTLAQAVRSQKKAVLVQKLDTIAAQTPAVPDGVFDVLVLDPPWPMQKIERDVRPNQSAMDYPTMSEADLLDWRIPATFAASDCHVFLWTTHRFLPLALACLKAWGFTYVLTMVWHKPGGFQPVGLPQYNCEFCLYARQGAPQFVETKAFNACFTAERGAHSEKPDYFYDLVRRVTAGRRLDICNRRAIPGFVGYGQEAVAT